MIDPLPPNPYNALGVADDANEAAIRTAYRKLVLKSHPDKFPDPALKAQKADEFHKIQQAYELLNDADRLHDYHDRVKLAKLRADLARDGGGGGPPGLRRAQTDFFASRSTPNTPMYEDRGNVRYEERAPKSARPAFPDERDRPPPPPRFESERRPGGARRYEDPYEPMPPLSSRKASAGYAGPHPDEHRRRSDAPPQRWSFEEEEADRARRSKKEEKAAQQSKHADRRRTRNRDRQRDHDSKRSYNHARVEEDTEGTDSSAEGGTKYVYASPRDPPSSGGRKRAEEHRHTTSARHVPLVSASGRRGATPGTDDSEAESTTSRYFYKIKDTENYIAQRGGKVPSSSGGAEKVARPGLTKSYSVMPRAPAPPLSSSPPQIVADTGRRSSAARRPSATPKQPSAAARERDRKSDKRPNPLIEIVEPSREYDGAGAGGHRRPGLTPSNSVPAPTQLPPRSATLESRPKSGGDPKTAPLRRAQTSPLSHMVSPTSAGHHAPARSSKLRPAVGTHSDPSDSGYESPTTPAATPRYAKEAFFSDDDDRHHRQHVRSPNTGANGIASPRFVPVEPPSSAKSGDRDRGRHRTHMREREREELSPRSHARVVPASPHPASGGASALRSPGYGDRSSLSPPPPSMRGASGNGPSGSGARGDRERPLFGEVRPPYSSNDVRYSPKIDGSSVQYAHVPRRGSGEEPRSAGRRSKEKERDRDAYPYEGSGGRRREMRGEGRRAQETY